jgi:hypothetical protein
VVERRLQWAVDVMRVVAMWPDRHHRVYTCVATLSCGGTPKWVQNVCLYFFNET